MKRKSQNPFVYMGNGRARGVFRPENIGSRFVRRLGALVQIKPDGPENDRPKRGT